MKVERQIKTMCLFGTSLVMSWDDDANAWEVDWITSGVRYRGVALDLSGALTLAYEAATGNKERVS